MTISQAGTEETVGALQGRLAEVEEMLRAIQHGEVDALVVERAGATQVYTLHSAEEPYRNLVEEMHEGAAVLTRGGDILYSNARFATLLGKPLESVVGSRIDRFVSADARAGVEALLAAGTGRRRAGLVGPHGQVFEVSLSLTTAASSNGERLNLIVTDLSELLEANNNRDRAEHDSQLKDEFLATLAHELRTPLGAISNAARVLELTHAGAGAPATGPREVIARQVGHISRLINDLLDVERVVLGKIHLDRRPVDMAEAVRRAVATFTSDIRLDRRLEVTTEPVWVDGDAMRLEQVLTNIVNNAVKYSPPGAQIRVALRAAGGDAVVTVDDTGFGIAPTLLPFVFDMYVQADRTLDRARGGLGIGLTLVRRLVELHGGTIVASSDGDGHGSRFVVRLKQIPSAEQRAWITTSTGVRSASRRVLVIEDSRDARDMLRLMLELDGHVVYAAADGFQGLELLKAERPDVAIIDIGLPRMDGYELARRIREEPDGRDMLLVALTGYGTPRDAQLAPDDGFNYHLVKPVDAEQLGRILGSGVDG